ncbi:universal stress protein [Rhodopseudomonas sp. WA056]|uniref:universal stress protein n=1 Tax=Rhodopseudomonas sp. WA056 TaxID=2269367 RepID=UPI0013DF77A5|nr:universal stress protein [Rhodopseudomonas sp. WA056]NEW86963.1 universal stress protein [Rhodopseudomonas sp. WA056]
MQRILVATDFSTRSDRALRRAVLLARQHSAAMTIVHVIDDDQPPALWKAEEREAQSLLNELAATVCEIDGVACDGRMAYGEPFQALADAADGVDADLVVLGPHRRQALRDIFIGTTAERTIRSTRRPVIMANAVPSAHYGSVLVATDLSDCSAHSIAEAQKLGLLGHSDVVVVHAFDAPAQALVIRSSMTGAQLRAYLAEEEAEATKGLTAFLARTGLQPARSIVTANEGTAADAIRKCVKQQRADLVVIGTRGRTAAARFILGSVAEEVLRESDIDVLIVPPATSEPD